MSEPPTDKGRERLAQRAWRAFTKHFWTCHICRNQDSDWPGREQFCPAGRALFMSVALTDDDRERLEVWAALVKSTPRTKLWEKVPAAAKSAGEFVVGIGAIVGVLYALGCVTDKILEHIHVRVDHHWWVYQAWHAWWWLIIPFGLVAGGRLWNPRSERARVLRVGLWAVGVCWLAFLGIGASIWPLFYFISHFGFLLGTVAFCCLLPSAAIGLAYLFDLARGRWPLIDRLKSKVCWVPDR